MSAHRKSFWGACLLLAAAGAAMGAVAARQAQTPLLAEFDIASDGDVLLVPVTIGGQQFQFMVGTNTFFTVFDVRLREQLGLPAGRTTPSTSDDGLSVTYFESPGGHVGPLKLPESRRVTYYDLTFLREVTGYEIDGVLGIDFLKEYVVQIDFDQSKLRFLSEVPADAGRSRPLMYSGERKLPQVAVNLKDFGRTLFSVSIGPPVGMGLEPMLFQEVCRQNELAIVSERQIKDEVRSVRKMQLAVLPEFKLAGRVMQDVVVSESPVNVLGLDFLVRYNLTFDFKNDQWHVNPSQQIDRTDSWNRNGLRCLKRHGQVVVELVDPQSPAEQAGLRIGDVLLQVNETDIDRFTMHQLRRFFRRDEETCRLKIRRSDEVLDVSLVQRDYYPPDGRVPRPFPVFP
jgi:hypothetical protein